MSSGRAKGDVEKRLEARKEVGTQRIYLRHPKQSQATPIRRGEPLVCKLAYDNVIAILSNANAEVGDPFVNAIFLAEDDLVRLQESLLRQSCPVIA